MTLKIEIKKIIKGDVADDKQILKNYSFDASLFEVKPRIVVFPKDADDIKSLVNFVNKNNAGSKNRRLSITARAAGTDMTGGPLGESLVIDFTKYLNRIKEVGSRAATAEPGVYYRDFEKETLKRDLFLPSYPASREICALGGMVANNSGGEKTLSYGKTEDYVEQLKVVLSDGNQYVIKPLNKKELLQMMKQKNFEGKIYRQLYKLIIANQKIIKQAKPKVSKNSAGYALWNVWDNKIFDLTKLFVGSQGTLGIITEIKVRLIKPKKYSKLLVMFANEFNVLPKLVSNILKYKPESFEVFDDKTLKLAIRYLFWRFSWRFIPEIALLVKNKFRLPRLVLLAEFTGDSKKEVVKKTLAAKQSIVKFNLPSRITGSDRDMQKYQTVRRESFNLLRHKIKDKKTAPFIDDIIVKPEYLSEFLPQLEKIMSHYDITYTIAGHIGDGNFHIIPLINLADKKAPDIISKLSKEVYDLVLKFKGSITAEHNDGLIRTPFLEQMYGHKIYELFREVKKIFDLDNIFNPGKKINGDLAYALKHLKKK